MSPERVFEGVVIAPGLDLMVSSTGANLAVRLPGNGRETARP